MLHYIGTKLVRATPMPRAEYNSYRSWQLPANENGADDGYLVEYLDGGQPNDPRHVGYISWSPKEQFDKAYRPTIGMNFGLAIEALKQGHKVARAGWNGKGMWLVLVHPDDDTMVPLWPAYSVLGVAGLASRCLPWIGMKTADDSFVPWLASQTDMLADDWCIVE